MLTLALFISYLGAAEPVKPASVSDDQVRAAIVAAVRQRMGNDIDVAVDNLVVQVAPDSAIVEALPEPGARLDGNIRFILRWAGTERSGARVIRAGAAVARVRVAADHAHTATLAARGVELGPNDVVAARHDIVAGPLRPWPTVADTVGSKTLRDLPPDACIARNAIAARPDVRTGEEVLAISRINGVVASGHMVAAESGDAGSVIRIVNQQSRRSLKARIVSPGLVEILK
jgi:flagella basal body P-ring formation protein FlgA